MRATTRRKTPRRLVVAGVFLVASVVTAFAHADQALVDNDLALPGNQNVVDLTALPGDTVQTSGRIVVQWNGNRHLAPGDSLTLSADPAATTLPFGYVVAPVTLAVPGSWGPGSLVSAQSAVSFSAPGAGRYRYAVKWSPHAAGPTCAGPPCLTGGSALVINLTVDRADTTISTQVRDADGNDVTGSSQPLGTTIHDGASVGGARDGIPITGSVTYRFFGTSDCSGGWSDETVPVGGDSTPRTPPAGAHSYSASYGGDANYNGSSSACEPIAILKADLESLTVADAQQLMNVGALTSVELTHLYLDRIAALNSQGPGLNAVRILNADALAEAAAADDQRAQGYDLGSLMGIPVLLKDNIDVAGLPTTAGAVALEQSLPPEDSTVAAKLRAGGAVILGKTNLSEFANFITNSNPSGYSGLGGQVLAGPDADLNPSGSSSGSATAAAAPMARTVADAAAELQVIAGPDPKDHSPTLWGPGVDDATIVPPQPSPVPDYLAALDPNALRGKRIGVVNNSEVNYQAAIATIQSLGTTAVAIPTPSAVSTPQVLFYEFKRDLNNYLAHLGLGAPVGSLAEVIDFNNANAQEAIKFGHTILIASQALDVADPSSSDSVAYRSNLVNGKSATRAAIDNALADNDLDAIMTPAGTLTGIGARAGYPQLTVPAGYAATTRRPVNISFNGTKYTEAKLIGFAYAYEQATHARRPVSVIDPSLYRCAQTDPPSPYASRGGCSPGKELLDVVGTPPDLGFSLETATASELESRLEDGTLTSVALTKAYLARIARTNTDGPSIDAVRSVDPQALDAAAASDARRTAGQSRGPLEGLPVLLNDDVDVDGLPTTLGSVALQDSFPAGNSMLTARLESAGAIVLGKTNTTELSGWTSTSMPGGYSSLGGQVLDPSDADITPSGSSSGAAAATAAGLAALTFGTGGSSVTGSLLSIVAPAQANGVVGLKPTVGLVSRAGILTITQTQETAGPIGRTVRDVAAGLQAVAGTDPADPATAGQPPVPDYLAALSPTALPGKRIAVVSSTDANYNAAVAAVQAAGATTVTKTIPAPSPNPADIVGRELKRHLNAYLGALPAGDRVHSLQEIVDYNLANAEEALNAFSEASLLADAYAYEQATGLRRAPSFMNPSLWRCVLGSAFPPHSCAP